MGILSVRLPDSLPTGVRELAEREPARPARAAAERTRTHASRAR